MSELKRGSARLKRIGTSALFAIPWGLPWGLTTVIGGWRWWGLYRSGDGRHLVVLLATFVSLCALVGLVVKAWRERDEEEPEEHSSNAM